jgi:hypothetical protein
MVTWIPSIYPLYVSIYTSTMDPMGMIIGIGDEINEWFMALLIGLYWINGSLSFANFLLAGEFHAYVREASCPVDPYASVVLDRPWILFATQSMELGWSPCLPHVFFTNPI